MRSAHAHGRAQCERSAHTHTHACRAHARARTNTRTRKLKRPCAPSTAPARVGCPPGAVARCPTRRRRPAQSVCLQARTLTLTHTGGPVHGSGRARLDGILPGRLHTRPAGRGPRLAAAATLSRALSDVRCRDRGHWQDGASHSPSQPTAGPSLSLRLTLRLPLSENGPGFTLRLPG